ncbi:MAG TPA: L-fucose/L-arabinose isomerase family protein [bacterium]|nr:L-fucose/L-arabinose isomerase family protein [bacterium]
MEKIGLGLIIGNRGFFPDHLCKEGREKILNFLSKRFEVITLTEKDTKFGSIETYQDAKKCADLFIKNRDKIDGIIVSLPNFGDERAVADTIKLSGLSVPVLIHAFPDDIDKMDVKNRRDSFCGKISVCNVLYQYGIKFTLTENHTEGIESDEFKRDIDKFERICRIVKGLKNLKLGAIGTRPDAFKTVRYSEKILEKNGISVDVLDLSEIFARISRIKDDDKRVKNEIEKFRNYMESKDVPLQSLIKFSKLKIVIKDWISQNDIKGIGFQCWTSIEENFGIVPCAVLSYLSDTLIPSACEVDITGTLSMYILQIASGLPSAIVDLNNNYKEEKDKVVLFHCSNFPVSVLKKSKISYQEIISESVGKENAYGAVIGNMKKSPFTFLRLSTDDNFGIIKGYLGEGEITDDKIETFGGIGVAKINNLQKLLWFICENGFEHHTIINLSEISDAVEEALVKYKNWSIYHHY